LADSSQPLVVTAIVIAAGAWFYRSGTMIEDLTEPRRIRGEIVAVLKEAFRNWLFHASFR
jgi:hypothetical protein